MVEVYIWICDFGLLEIKQNGFKIFRGLAPLSYIWLIWDIKKTYLPLWKAVRWCQNVFAEFVWHGGGIPSKLKLVKVKKSSNPLINVPKIEITSQSLEDTQVGYILQKYILEKYFGIILKFGQNSDIWPKI